MRESLRVGGVTNKPVLFSSLSLDCVVGGSGYFEWNEMKEMKVQ